MLEIGENHAKKPASKTSLLVVLGIIFLPAVLTALVFNYTLLRKLKQKPSVSTVTFFAVEFILLVLWVVTNSSEKIKYFFTNITDFKELWPEIVIPILIINLALGAGIGLFSVMWDIYQIRKNPYRTHLEGGWEYKFKYRRSPLELFRRNKVIQNLKDGEYAGSGRAPLGLDEENGDVVAYRFDEEAVKQTLISGGVGSGKPLHGDTLVPTLEGFKKIREVKEKDQVFSPSGSTVSVQTIHHPKINQGYLMKFSCGEEIIAGDEHLWPVVRSNNLLAKEEILSTEALYNSIKNGEEYFIRRPVNSVEAYDKEKIVLEVEDIVADYGFTRHDGIVIVDLPDKESLIKVRSLSKSIGWGVKKVSNLRLEILKEVTSDDISRKYEDHIISVEPVDSDLDDFYCITVDSESHLFLVTESFIATHNTITMLSLIYADIQDQKPVVIIDFKRSPQLAAKTATWAKEANAGFYHFASGDPRTYSIENSPGQANWDPLAIGSRTYKADMVLNMRKYDTASAVYKDNMQQLLQVLFAMIEEADRSKAPSIEWNSGGIKLLASTIKDDNLTELAIACEGTYIQAEAESIAQQSKGKTQIRHAMEALGGQLRTITASDYGQWMKFTEGERNIKLHELTSKGNNVILFSLNSDDEPEFATYVGSMILSNITAVSAIRRNEGAKRQMNVYVDEFQAVPPTSVTSLLEKSRESKIAMTLAQQSFEQIVSSADSNGEAYLLSILDTCSNFIIHAGMTEDSAERLSKILGKHTVTSYSRTNQSSTFLWSLNWRNKRNSIIQTKNEDRWIYEPGKFLKLSSPDKNNNFKSTAVIINKVTADERFKNREGGAIARRVWMIPSVRVLEEFNADMKSSIAAKTTPLSDQPVLEYEYDDNEEDFLSFSSRMFNEEYNQDSSSSTVTEYEAPREQFDGVNSDEPEDLLTKINNKPTSEEIDGDFSWEALDDEAEKEMFEISRFSQSSLPEKKKDSGNDFNDLFNKNFEPQKLKKIKEKDDEDELPDIDF